MCASVSVFDLEAGNYLPVQLHLLVKKGGNGAMTK